MKLSETISKLYDDLSKCGENELVGITFAGITWKLEAKSLMKILVHANQKLESQKT